ncbi:hypothetical protein C0J52_21980, partial [Blattella germanica]
DSLQQIKTHQGNLNDYCRRWKNESWYLRTDCNAFIPYLRSKVRYLDNRKEDINEFTLENLDNVRTKHGILKLEGILLNNKIQNMEKEIYVTATVNEQVYQLQRVIEECQTSFELILNAFIHAQVGVIQPQVITAQKLKAILSKSRLPSDVEYPSFPTAELNKIMTPIIYIHQKYLVYIVQVPLLFPTQYQLYKILPFPVHAEESHVEAVYMYTSSKRDYIFSDPLRQKFGKLTFSELQSCSKPNEFHYPIHTHVSGTDCEATLLQPTNKEVPISCELRVLKLQQTFWIPLDSGYEWLYVAPRKEILSTLCTGVLRSWTIDGRGRLELQPGCKVFGTHTTLYALSTTTMTSNMTSDIFPISPIELACCFSDHEKELLPELNLNVPLSNILTHSDDLNMASHKIEEIQQLIKDHEWKSFHSYQSNLPLWSSFAVSMTIFLSCFCICCCLCKPCRKIRFWIWDNFQPRDWWKQIQEHCCLYQNISIDGVRYEAVRTSTEFIPATTAEPASDVTLMMQPGQRQDQVSLEDQPIGRRTRSQFRSSTWR